MEIKATEDIGEEIIRQLKEFNLFLQKKLKELKNEKQRKNLLQNKQ